VVTSQFPLWVVGILAGVFETTALDLLLTIAWVILVTNAINLMDKWTASPHHGRGANRRG
jgi:UDP-N-acetylmuramyl pentapeptide phosphotransferase/UDP-N-acetylglucosamine-1-phosphate transferase